MVKASASPRCLNVQFSSGRTQPKRGRRIAALPIDIISSMLPRIEPLRLQRKPRAFNDPDWLFEIKFDGFRSLAYIKDGECDLVSLNRNTFKSFAVLSSWLGQNLKVESAVIDGEI